MNDPRRMTKCKTSFIRMNLNCIGFNINFDESPMQYRYNINLYHLIPFEKDCLASYIFYRS